MEIKLYNDYWMDENGDVFKGQRKIKPYKVNGYFKIVFGRKEVSWARIIATYFCYNENGYERLIYIDGNPDNCKASNLKWVSDAEYAKRIAVKRSRTDLDFNPDLDFFNEKFIEAYKTFRGERKKHISGRVYLEVFERYVRGGVRNLKAEIFNSYKYAVGLERRLIEEKNTISLEKIFNYENVS